jgi:predicted acylesterase/phospholipase RssA
MPLYVLVLQGGGSLGAYKAGAYKALYEWLSEKDKKEGRKKSPTFDIIAGTSIGTMNASVLTSYVIENGTYEGSAERLIDFWNYLSKESIVDSNPWFKPWWDYLNNINNAIATGEAAEDTIQRGNLPYPEYQTYFLLSHLCLITSFLICITIPVIALAINR